MTQFVLDPAKLMETAANKQNAIRSREKTLKPKDGSNRYVLLPGGVGSKVSKTCGSTISVCTLLKMQTVIYSLLMFV